MPNSVEHVEKFVELLAYHEEAIGDLYKAYEKRFPNFDLWKKLARDEKHHAMWIRSFLHQTNFSGLSINLKLFSEKNLQKSINHIKNQTKRAKQESLYGAIKNAFRIEESVVEQKVLHVFVSKNPKVVKKIASLEKATEHHADIIYKELKKFDTV